LIDKVQSGRFAVACLLFGQIELVFPLDISPYYFYSLKVKFAVPPKNIETSFTNKAAVEQLDNYPITQLLNGYSASSREKKSIQNTILFFPTPGQYGGRQAVAEQQ
jgi:hypothetical protein